MKKTNVKNFLVICLTLVVSELAFGESYFCKFANPSQTFKLDTNRGSGVKEDIGDVKNGSEIHRKSLSNKKTSLSDVREFKVNDNFKVLSFNADGVPEAINLILDPSEAPKEIVGSNLPYTSFIQRGEPWNATYRQGGCVSDVHPLLKK